MSWWKVSVHFYTALDTPASYANWFSVCSTLLMPGVKGKDETRICKSRLRPPVVQSDVPPIVILQGSGGSAGASEEPRQIDGSHFQVLV